MRYFKVITLSIIFLLCCMIGICSRAYAVETQYGYVLIKYLDNDNKQIMDTQTIPTPLIDNKGTCVIMPGDLSIKNYEISEDSTASGVLSDGTMYTKRQLVSNNGIKINVNKENTVNNPLILTVFYTPMKSKRIPVYLASIYHYDDGTPNTYRNVINAATDENGNGYSNKYSVTQHNYMGDYEECYIEYEYRNGSKIKNPWGAGDISDTGEINIKQPQDNNVVKINCLWIFKGKKVDTITFTIIDNFITSSGKVVNGLNGTDWFGRYDKLWDESLPLTVSSKTKGLYTKPDGSTKQLVLSKVIYEKGQGQPAQALKNIYKQIDSSLIGADTQVSFNDIIKTLPNQYIHYYWIFDEGEPVEPTEPTEPTEPENKPPLVYIDAPERVIQGDDLVIKGDGKDPEGGKVKLEWHPGNLEVEKEFDKRIEGWFSETGFEFVSLYGTDPEGLQGSAEARIEVKPPRPQVLINHSGNKVNKKISINMYGTKASQTNGKSNIRYPIDYNKTIWEISIAQGPITLNDIKMLLPYTIMKNESGQDVIRIIGNNQVINILSKKEGKINVRCTVENKAGCVGFTSCKIPIKPDVPPIADFTMTNSAIRDPNNMNKAKLEIKDTSSSPDNDIIGKRIWFYTYDSNNDGNFENEVWYVYNSGIWRKVSDFTGGNGNYSDLKNIDIENIDDRNLTSIQIISPFVGRYKVELIVREGINIDEDPLIKKYVNTNDFLIDNTFDH